MHKSYCVVGWRQARVQSSAAGVQQGHGLIMRRSALESSAHSSACRACIVRRRACTAGDASADVLAGEAAVPACLACCISLPVLAGRDRDAGCQAGNLATGLSHTAVHIPCSDARALPWRAAACAGRQPRRQVKGSAAPAAKSERVGSHMLLHSTMLREAPSCVTFLCSRTQLCAAIGRIIGAKPRRRCQWKKGLTQRRPELKPKPVPYCTHAGERAP